MNLTKRILALILVTGILTSCSSDDNSAPTEVSNVNVFYDFADFDSILVEWDASSDDEGDDITYDILVNDTVLASDIELTGTSGSREVDYDFSALNEDITVTIISSDNTGSSEVNLTTDYANLIEDTDLGLITDPVSSFFAYDLTTGVDRVGAVRIDFSIDEITNFTFQTISADHDTEIALFSTVDGVDTFIGGNDDGGVGFLSFLSGSLVAGTYAIELDRFGGDITGTGVLSFDLN